MTIQKAKRLYSVPEFFGFVFAGFSDLGSLKLMKRKDLVNEAFFERLMLAVTEVNGCRYCSYFHAEQALKVGMSGDEVTALLGGDHENVPEDEAVAILFAQHYAESGGKPNAEASARLIEAYGEEKARAILNPIRMIMIGNVSGNNYDGLVHRLKGEPFEGSRLDRELGVVLGILVAAPVGFLKGLLKSIVR